MLTALDNYRSDAKSSSHSGPDGRSNRPADDSAYHQPRTCRSADFRHIRFYGALSDRRPFRIDTFYVVSFNSHYFNEGTVKVAPSLIVQNDSVEGKQHFTFSLYLAGFF